MKLILGLGNPGPEYGETRHNLGFRVVERLAGRRGVRVDRLDCNALVARHRELTLAKPQTYMNRSGFAARCLVERESYEPADLLVVYDDVWLPLGKLRLRARGGPGGHRGMESVLENLRTERIPRLRLGVGWEGGPPESVDLVEHVLSPFARDEREVVEEMIDRAADACECWASEGAEAAMSRFN